MPIVVYWDILWAVNFLLDAVLLACTAYVMAKKLSLIKVGAAAAFGATYALTPLFNSTAFLYHPVLKICIAFVMVALAMKFTSIIDFLKVTGFFFGISFFAGGTAIALSNVGESLFTLPKNYFLWVITAVFSILLFAKAGFFRLRSIFAKSSCKMVVRVSVQDETVETAAILDTGNELSCPLTGKPVIIMNSDSLRRLLPDILQKDEELFEIEKLPNDWKKRIQVIPYSALGGRGMLTVIRPDKVEISVDKEHYTPVQALVGLARRDFCKDKNYQALVSTQLLPL